MDLPPSILFVGAHCDDIELFAGGLLARACRLGRDVGVLVVSDHRGVASDAEADRSRVELAQNIDFLHEITGTRPRDHSGLWLPACQGAFERERGAVYSALEALRERYALVVTHPPGDTNQDHRQVVDEVRRVFKLHSSAIGGEFPANDLGSFAPQLYVPLSEEDLAAKVRMIERYQSQRRSHRRYLDETVVRALARVRGSQIHEAAAEAFEVVTRVVLRG